MHYITNIIYLLVLQKEFKMLSFFDILIAINNVLQICDGGFFTSNLHSEQ